MDALELTFNDIENAIISENISMSGGEIKLGDSRRSIRIIGEFQNMEDIENIVVKNEDINIVYLKRYCYCRLWIRRVGKLRKIEWAGCGNPDGNKKRWRKPFNCN